MVCIIANKRRFSKTCTGVTILCLMILSLCTLSLNVFKTLQFRPKSHSRTSSGIFETYLDPRANFKSKSFYGGRKFDIILFHSLPKCGSRTLFTLAEMSEDYRKNLLAIDGSTLYSLPVVPDNMSGELFMRDFFTTYLKKLPKNYNFVYTHGRFVDLQKPEWRIRYVSIVRDPLSRLVSWYYYRMNRDETNLTKSETQRHSQRKDLSRETFDECVQHGGSDCVSKFLSISTITHFCGYHLKCSTDGEFALARAKQNVVRYFDVVGIMEDYSSFVQVLEAVVSPTFRGAVNNYLGLQNGTDFVSNTKTKGKVFPSKETVQIMTEKLFYDYKFYNFIKDRFYKQKQALGV